jgi:hypothetical protein
MYLTSLIDMPSANDTESEPGKGDTLDAYTEGIIPHSEIQGAPISSESKEEILTHVLHALNGTRDDLQDAVSNIAFARDRIANHDAAGDWTFVEELHTLFSEQLTGLERRKGTLDALKRSCELAMTPV